MTLARASKEAALVGTPQLSKCLEYSGRQSRIQTIPRGGVRKLWHCEIMRGYLEVMTTTMYCIKQDNHSFNIDMLCFF